MKLRRWSGVAALVVCAWLVVAVWQGRGAERTGALEEPAASAASLDADVQDFNGKVLSVHIEYPDKGAGHVLKDVHARRVGGHTFLVGTGITVGPKPNPYDGRTVWVSVDRIIQIVVYKDLDEMQKAYDKLHPKEPDAKEAK